MKLVVYLALGLFILSSLVCASAATSLIRISNCAAENRSTTYNSFGLSCNDPTGNNLNASDANYEIQTWAYGTPTQWGGVRINSSDATVTNCKSITNVHLCYTWWDDATSKYPDTCNITVSNNSGSSYVSVNSTCPAHSKPGSMICANVTNLTTWTCNNFFGASARGAIAAAQLTKSSTPSNNANVLMDVFVFNVTYTQVIYPNVTLVSPNSGNISSTSLVNFTCNATTPSGLSNITFYWNYSGSFIANGTATVTGTGNQTTFNRTVSNDGNYTWNCYACDTSNNCTFNSTNRTFTVDTTKPSISIYSPLADTRYNSQQIQINFTASDLLTPVSYLWFYNETGNTTFTYGSLVYQNFSYGNHTFIFYANDSAGNLNQTNVTFTVNGAPNLTSITASPSPIMGGGTITINSTINDVNNDTIYFYCSEVTQTPDSSNNNCSEGNKPWNIPYNSNCTYITRRDTATHTVYCRAYDGLSYSSVINTTYSTVSTIPTTSIVSVAGDTSLSYFDTVNDGHSDIIVSGSTNITCRWGDYDQSYSSMSSSNGCNAISGDPTQANCSVDDVAVQNLTTRYISCKDSLGNEQNSSQNIDVSFYLDYTAPTTYDDSDSNVHAPNYYVTITEQDNLLGDPTTYYCTSSTPGCNPTTLINNGEQITYTSSNRGLNYLRYYSVDYASNTQTIVNRTININLLPIFTSASDNVTIIKGGSSIGITTVNYDPDAQTIYLYVCNSSQANSSGCLSMTYCNSSGTSNLSCSFSSETDTASHTWYAFIYDSSGEGSSSNPRSHSYTTDSTAPTINVTNPENNSNTSQTSITAQINLSEAASSAWYSLDSGSNTSMTNISSTSWYSQLTGLSQTNHTVRFYANDTYGNLATSVIYFTIIAPPDTVPPIITIVSPVNASYNSPNNFVINISADENLSWAGYKLNSGDITSLSQTSPTSWYAVIDLSQESSYNLTVYANDTSNNTNNKSIMFYTDTLAPRYSGASANPSPSNVSDQVNCSVTWTDVFNLSSVIISENSSGIFENHTISFSGISGIASYYIVGNKLTNYGTYACIFYATDSAGNMNSTSVHFVVQDLIPPSIVITSPINETYSQDWVSSAITADKPVSSAGYSLNGAPNVSMTNLSSTAWSKTISSLSDGAYTIVFYAIDLYGSVGFSSSRTFTVNTTAPDTIPPVITVDSITNGTYKTSSTTVELNITTNENAAWAGYILNGGSLVDMYSTSSTTWTASLTGLGSESTNTIKVYANDTSYNTGNTNITFFVDLFAPRLTSASASPDPANETQSVTCNIYVDDTFSLSLVKIAENSSGSFVNHTIDLYSTGWANFTINNMAKGNYSCIFYARDVAGNINTSSVTFEVQDFTPPSITINSPLNYTYGLNTVLLSVTLDENSSEVYYSFDGGITNQSMSGSSKSWSKSVTLSDSLYNVTFYAYDNSGNTGTNSLLFTVDTSINDFNPPIITVISPINNSYSQASSIILNITSNEKLNGSWYSLDGAAIVSMSNSSLYDWNATLSLTDGNHNLTIYSNDSSSNKNQRITTLSITIDTADPAITTCSCTNPVNNTRNVSCTLSATDNVGLSYGILSYNASGEFANSSELSISGTSGNASYVILSNETSLGMFEVDCYTYDLSGRYSTSSSTVTVLDDVAPEIYNITLTPNASAELDPGVNVTINASVIDDYSLSNVNLMYRNASSSDWASIPMTNGFSTNYNATLELANGTWYFKINATDSQGNQNISSNTTAVIEYDSTYTNSSSILAVKSYTLSQAGNNNSLGSLSINNTGDTALNFTISIDSSIASRFNINNSGNTSVTQEIYSGASLTLTISINTTDLPAALYYYNITISSAAGTSVYQNQLYIQSATGPYLVVNIDTYSSSVTRNQTRLTYSATVRNYGSLDATGVHLNWTLPSIFSITSGNLSRYIGNLPIGISGSNTIIISVSNNVSDSSVLISADASSADGSFGNDSKNITITDPLVITQSTTVNNNQGGGGGGGRSIINLTKSVSRATEKSFYSKEIEIVRGNKTSFDLEVKDNYIMKMHNLTLYLEGFPKQYVEISPLLIDSIEPGSSGIFTVILTAPLYKSYEEHTLTAVISGILGESILSKDYIETQYIKLIIQEFSREQVLAEIDRAREAIALMAENSFNIQAVEKMLLDAQDMLSNHNNTQAISIVNQIESIKDKAFEAAAMILDMKNSFKSYQISKGVEETFNMALAAFQRGDYDLALERLSTTKLLILMSKKGDLMLYLYLYWKSLSAAAVMVLVAAILSFRQYKKSRIKMKIAYLNREESNIKSLILRNQRKYFHGKLPLHEFNLSKLEYEKQLASIKKRRLNLRNKRIKLLSPEKVVMELDSEKDSLESEIKSIQDDFYNHRKISEEEYKIQFNLLNERLAEIESERIALRLMHRTKKQAISHKTFILNEFKAAYSK